MFLKPWSRLTSRTHSERIGEYCSISGGGFTKMGSAIHGSAQKKTNQWSREFPLFALSSSDLKQEVHRLVIQPAAKAPPSKKRVHTRLPTPPPRIGPSSSHSSHEAPPPPPGPPPPINNQIQYTPVFWSLCDIHIQPATVGDSTDDSDD